LGLLFFVFVRMTERQNPLPSLIQALNFYRAKRRGEFAAALAANFSCSHEKWQTLRVRH
jgi:hypothetical protein